MNVNEDIERKIRDYLNGELTTVGETELLRWINLDQENKAYFLNRTKCIDISTISHPLLQSSYTELKNKLFLNHQFISKQNSKSRKLQFSFLKIAAMLLVAVLSGFSIAYLLLPKKTVKTESMVVWFETKVPRGEKSQLVLPDGSKIWVNSESSISYPSNFMDGNRKIKLTGEAYFEVAKLQAQPFIVNTHDYDIHVTGTRFNVMAYNDFGRTETSLIDGKIDIQKGQQTIPVTPGQTLTFADNHFDIKNANTNIIACWKDDIFDFDRITFQELVSRLERWYDVDIEIKSPELYEIVYSGVFKNEETIWQVLNTFELTLPIRYKRTDFRKFVIEKNNKKI
jgi:ferric-dicitrate binding protein FerR (iron transport regulator)